MKDHPKKHIILVIEDDVPIQKAIQTKLVQRGFDVICVRGVDEAIKALKARPKKEAIWLDHYLFGKKDGLDFVTKIKSEKSQWKNIPIFVVSNSASDQKVRSYMNLGIDKFFVKSEHPLSEIIDDLVNVFESED